MLTRHGFSVNIVVAVIARDEEVEILIWLLNTLDMRCVVDEVSQRRQICWKFRVLGQTAFETTKHRSCDEKLSILTAR